MLAKHKVRSEQAERDVKIIRFKDAKLKKITLKFELARLKVWRFGASPTTERRTAQMFETTADEDEPDLTA